MIKDRGVYLRLATNGDYAKWSALRSESRMFLRLWEPAWIDDDTSFSAYAGRMARWQYGVATDSSYSLLCFRSRDDVLFGAISFDGVRRGSAQSALMGGWVGRQFAGTGLAYRATCVGLGWAMGSLGLHRVEAATIPENVASARLLEACGLKREGAARSYGKINGEWRDHVLWSIVSGDAIGLERKRKEVKP